MSQLPHVRRAAAAALGCLSALPAPAQEPLYRVEKPEHPIVVPFELNDSHVFVQVRVNGSRPLSFIFDTGAASILIDRRVAEELELEQFGAFRASGVGERAVPATTAEGVEVALGSLVKTDCEVTVLSLAMLEPHTGRRVHGVLGNDFLKRLAFEIDYRAQRVRLHLPMRFEYDGEGEVVPIRWRGGSPHVVAKVAVPGREPVRGLFLVDSGASMTMGVGRPWTDQHDLLSAFPTRTPFRGGYGIGGESTGYSAYVDSLQLGELVFEGVPCAFYRDEQGMFADENRAGLIGGDVLRRCRVIFDYPRMQMILEPQPGFDEPFRGSRTGLALIAGGTESAPTITVHRAAPRSPGYRAGVREGDVIEFVDGRAATEFTLHTLKLYFEGKKTVELQLRRGGEELRVELVLTRNP